jgi:hypothetical protein
MKRKTINAVITKKSNEWIDSMMFQDLKLAKKLELVFTEIIHEHIRQNEKWGEQNHPMLNAPFSVEAIEPCIDEYKAFNNTEKNKSWFTILMEEICESFFETEPEKQREEMIQVAAVAVQIIEYLDRQIRAENEAYIIQ